MLVDKVRLVGVSVALLAVTVLDANGAKARGAARPMPAFRVPGRRPAAAVPDSPLKRFTQAEAVFTAKLEDVRWGPTGMSMPPLYTAKLTFEVAEVLRGPQKAGDRLTLSYRKRQRQRPNLPVGQRVLVVTAGGGSRVLSLEAVTPELLKTARAATALPLGWRYEGGKALCPWVSLGKKAWPAGAKMGAAKLACSQTGRPALLAGPGIALTVAPVPPKEKIRWTNPDGDGELTLTVTNTTTERKTVAALLTDGKTILWEECLAVICQGKTQPLPTAKGIAAPPTAVVLEAGQSASTVVNALTLGGLKWPRGGYRINFQFCLGELSATQSMYYMSRHHDKLREEAVRALEAARSGDVPG